MSTPTPRHRRRASSVSQPLVSNLVCAARTLQPRTVALRRTLHRHPEQGLHLPKTQSAVLRALADLPVRVHTGRGMSSVVGVIEGARPGPTVLLRADMDALPVTEQSGVPFSSKLPGSMHACGHDTHVAMLVSAARLIAEHRGELVGRVLLMFQPGEEGFHGARLMLDEGLLEVAGTPERALAVHITSTLDRGVLQTRPGAIMASSDVLRVTVAGRGGHASAPQNAVDPVPAAAAMVGALQTMVTRTLNVFDPAVLTVTRIAAGTTSNIIPETAELQGTIRTLSEHTRTKVREEVCRVCEHVAAAHGCIATVSIEHGYPVTVNDDEVSPQVIDLARRLLGERHAEPMPDPLMGAEDFSYVLAKVPGAVAFLGACPAGREPDTAPANHSNRAVFDESAMVHGVALYAGFALEALAQ
ncbi:MAG: M20 family metallopeptidase [Actinomycetota bacterium]|nr:M20 family metallopeptidase [Actinomycetota bacterium]